MAKARRFFPPGLLTSGISRPVSRVLYDGIAPAWQPFLWDACCQTPRAANPSGDPKTDLVSRATPIRLCSRWGLPCRSCCQERGALLPHLFTLTAIRRPRRYLLCGTFPGVAPAGRYPAPYLRGARTFLDAGASRLPGRLTPVKWVRGRARSRKMARARQPRQIIVNEVNRV
jgi:hypothetical protein